LANVEAAIDTTATYNPEEAVKVFNLVTEALKTVRPAYATKSAYVETSEAWVHDHNRDEITTDTTPTATPHPFVVWRAVHERIVVGSTSMVSSSGPSDPGRCSGLKTIEIDVRF